ncbi:hypothetical protein ACJ65_09800 [Kocuria rhizophila]|nr:hypothetical protein ACJ65_09800 [Kocuria rhizophila]
MAALRLCGIRTVADVRDGHGCGVVNVEQAHARLREPEAHAAARGSRPETKTCTSSTAGGEQSSGGCSRPAGRGPVVGDPEAPRTRGAGARPARGERSVLRPGRRSERVGGSSSQGARGGRRPPGGARNPQRGCRFARRGSTVVNWGHAPTTSQSESAP